MAPTKKFKETLLLKGLVSDLGMIPNDANVFSNSQNAKHLAKKGQFHERTKNIKTKIYFIKDVDDTEVSLHKIRTSVNTALTNKEITQEEV